MASQTQETCYLCGAPKYSDEHVPARCFFPEDPKYRVNLIKVASCKKHNELTSMDDEYVRNIICMSIGNNAVAFQQFIDKTLKSFIRRPALKTMTLENTKAVYVRDQDGFHPTFAFEIDRQRFDKVMKKIGYALYYHEYQQIWQRGLIVATDSLLDSNMWPDDYGLMLQLFRKQLNVPAFDGSNPKVFQYKFMDGTLGDRWLWMKFYEGFEVFVIPEANTSKPDEI